MKLVDKSAIKPWNEPRKKVIGVPLKKGMVKNSDGTLIVPGYFTSDNKDEVGDVITRGATERAIPKYRQWMNVRRMHQPDPVAKVLRIGEEDGLAWNELELKVIDPKAVFEVEQGLLSALSVGILVKYDDIDFLEDGGWIINDYTLAEISLVDHPANYDAYIQYGIPVGQDLRMLARQYGFDAVACSMKRLLDGETGMETDNLVVENAVHIDLEPVEEEPAVEPVVEDAPEAEQVVEVEAEIDAEAQPVAEPEVEQEQAGEPEAEVEVAAGITETEEAVEEQPDLLETVLAEVRTLRDTVNALRESLEITTKALSAMGQVAGDAISEEAGSLNEVEGEQEPEQTGTAANRKGAVQETTLPTQEEVDSQSQPDIKPSLKAALAAYFTNR